jgi:hypothetical protein
MNIRSESFLWIHLAGIALFPGLIGITWVALAIGDSFNYILELLLLAAIAIAPILFMQLFRPFDIFSVLVFSLQPECLSDRQRTILSLFKTFKQKLMSVVVAAIMVLMLWLLYSLSPLAIGMVDFLPQWRICGIAIAALAFLGSNLLVQVPLSALQVLMAKKEDLLGVEPYPSEQIESSFTIPGIKVSKIL